MNVTEAHPIGHVRAYPVYEGDSGLFGIVDLGEGNRRTVPVRECHICGAFEFRGDDIEIHELGICGACADTIMNLKHYKHSGLYLTWPNERPQNTYTRPTSWISRTRRNELYERDGYRCRYCGGYKGLSLDHLNPIRHGGTHESSNLVTCCRQCNTRKGARTPEEAGMALLPPPSEAAP